MILVTGDGGCSPEGEVQVVAAVEIIEKASGRLRRGVIPDASAANLHPFVQHKVPPGHDQSQWLGRAIPMNPIPATKWPPVSSCPGSIGSFPT